MERSDPDYDVTGDGNPSPNGEYWYAGEHTGNPYYRRTDSAYFLYYHIPLVGWVLSTVLGGHGNGWWQRVDGIEGSYNPNAPYTGNPVVAAR